MDLFVHLLQTICIKTSLQVLTELFGISLLIILLQLLHVLANVTAKDVLGVRFSIEFVILGVVAGESLHGVRDVEATVDGAFESTEDLVTGGGSRQTGVEEASEWAGAFFGGLDVVLVTVDFGLTDIKGVE